MISEERWKRAQEGEAAYWSGCGADGWRILHELTEHCDRIVPHLKAVLAGRSGLDAIEIGIGGVGMGCLAAHVANHCSRIVGVEPLPIEAIELEDKALEAYAREIQSRVDVVRAKGEDLPFDDESFDLACCINVLDHTHDPHGILDEAQRVTKTQGLFVLAVHTRSTLVRIKWRIAKALGLESKQQTQHPHTFSWRKLNRQLQRRNWRVLWRSEPSLFRKLAGFAILSVWILEKL